MLRSTIFRAASLPKHPIFARGARTPSQLASARPRPTLSTSPQHRAFQTTSRQQAQRQTYQRFNSGGNQSQGPVLAQLMRRWASSPTFYYQLGAMGGVGGGVYIYNLEEVPVSGRRRFNLISPEREAALARDQYRMTLQQYHGKILPAWDARSRQVRRVLERLLPASGLQDGKEWTIDVIDSDETNAFVIPGGHVFVFSGILPLCQGDDGLAAVLGHEIGHNVAHHISEQLTRSYLLLAVAWTLEAVGVLPINVSRSVFSLAFEAPGSRMQETEADYIGLLMMAQSCYDPEEAVHFWGRMQEEEKRRGGSVPQFLSTHPSSHNREQKLRELLPKAREMALTSNCGNTGTFVDGFRQSMDQYGVPNDKWA